MRELNFLFMAEQQRISDLFVEAQAVFPFRWTESEANLVRSYRPYPRLWPHYRRRLMRLARRFVRKLCLGSNPSRKRASANIARGPSICGDGNSFLKKLAGAGLSELTRMPHALNPEKGLRVRPGSLSKTSSNCATPIAAALARRHLFAICCGRKLITNDAREFLRHLLEVNSSRVQNDVLNRIQKAGPPTGRDPQIAAPSQPHCRTGT